jgi:hypothetical protein
MPPKTRAKALNYHAIQLDPAGKAATYDNWAAVLASGPLGGGLKFANTRTGADGMQIKDVVCTKCAYRGRYRQTCLPQPSGQVLVTTCAMLHEGTDV